MCCNNLRPFPSTWLSDGILPDTVVGGNYSLERKRVTFFFLLWSWHLWPTPRQSTCLCDCHLSIYRTKTEAVFEVWSCGTLKSIPRFGCVVNLQDAKHSQYKHFLESGELHIAFRFQKHEGREKAPACFLALCIPVFSRKKNHSPAFALLPDAHLSKIESLRFEHVKAWYRKSSAICINKGKQNRSRCTLCCLPLSVFFFYPPVAFLYLHKFQRCTSIYMWILILLLPYAGFSMEMLLCLCESVCLSVSVPTAHRNNVQSVCLLVPKPSTSLESLRACLDERAQSSRAVLATLTFASEFHDKWQGDVSGKR